MSATVLQGDCRELMRAMPAASVDSVVCDPPYDLVSVTKRLGKPGSAPIQHGTDGAYARAARGFMGQQWDGTGVAFDPATWVEVLRVLKPGGHLLAFGGTRTYHRMATAIEDAGFELRDQIAWLYGSGFPKSHNLDGEHDGWGTALKPAMEPIAVARKPLAGTVAANMATYGVGALNINACRILAAEECGRTRGTFPYSDDAWGAGEGSDLGRWPANVIHDGSDDVMAAFPAAPGQMGDVRGNEASVPGYSGGFGRSSACTKRGDTGSAARFFYCAKASKADREEGCDKLPLGRGGCETFDAAIRNRAGAERMLLRRNTHATVKPEALMRYLVRLVTPVGGTLLDPFAGSGSTGKAAVLEGMSFIGCELTAEYVPIAEARIAAAVQRKAEAERVEAERHPDLFGAAA